MDGFSIFPNLQENPAAQKEGGDTSLEIYSIGDVCPAIAVD